VFLDTSDLHTYFDRENYYGPILFEFDLELVKDENFEIWITKDNPIRWNKDTPYTERYFQNIEELRELWDTIKRERKMITIRNNSYPILFNYVRRVIVDDPRLLVTYDGKQIHLFNTAKSKIIENLPDNHILKNKFIPRTDCSKRCYCRQNYKDDYSPQKLKRFFL
jgi:hypothetical protein